MSTGPIRTKLDYCDYRRISDEAGVGFLDDMEQNKCLVLFACFSDAQNHLVGSPYGRSRHGREVS